MKKVILIIMLLLPLSINAQIQKERKWARMHYMDKLYIESFKEFSQLAKFMDPGDLFMLAQHYQYGQGTERNLNKAIECYKLASERGDDLSQAELCDILFSNKMYESDKGKKELYKYSRMFSTNYSYSSSTGSVEDNARFALYLCYKNGWGTQANPLLADIWLAYAAYNDSMDAQDEFCEKFGINGDYNSEEEEMNLECTYFRHLYERISPYIKEDKTIETSFFEIIYLISKQDTNATIEGLKKILLLYDNSELDSIGKAVLHNLIMITSKYNNDLKEKYGSDIEKYELISEEEKEAWQYKQLTKVVWKVDVILNKTNKPYGRSNGHDWVDLGLPSGTKWSTRNIGAEEPQDPGALYAWAESVPKKIYSYDNYTEPNLYILDDANDTARQILGGKWNVPTCEDWRELFLYCDVKYDAVKSVFIAKGPNNQYVTIPLVQNSEKDGVIYWTNTCVLSVMEPEEGSAISFLLDTDPYWNLTYANKWRGCPVRPVLKD